MKSESESTHDAVPDMLELVRLHRLDESLRQAATESIARATPRSNRRRLRAHLWSRVAYVTVIVVAIAIPVLVLLVGAYAAIRWLA
jgi:hypothetical protein